MGTPRKVVAFSGVSTRPLRCCATKDILLHKNIDISKIYKKTNKNGAKKRKNESKKEEVISKINNLPICTVSFPPLFSPLFYFILAVFF
jgi:hypothetical protein